MVKDPVDPEWAIKRASEVRPGDVVDGKEVVEVRRVQFRDEDAQARMRVLVVDRGMTVERAADVLGLVEGQDWRWVDATS